MPTLALLGSGEFTPWAAAVDRWCAERARTDSDRAVILPTASAQEGDEVFDRWGSMGAAHYAGIGLTPEVLPVKTRDDAERDDIASAVAGARIIFFSGGNPGYLAETLRGTALWRAILRTVAEGTALGGCSAGAAAFGTRTFNVARDAIERWVDGLGLLSNAYVAPHFDALDGYQPGLRRRMLSGKPPRATVVGIDEDTALYGDDGSWRVAGRGAAWIGEHGDEDLRAYRDGDDALVRLGVAVP